MFKDIIAKIMGNKPPTEKINMESISFKMQIQDIFKIQNVGVVLTGVVAAGSVTVGKSVYIATNDGTIIHQDVVGFLESMNGNADLMAVGDDIGIGFKNKQVAHYAHRGMFLVVGETL